MIDPDVFNEMLKMLGDVHTYWRPIGDTAKGAMLTQLNRYGVDDKEFGDYCLKVMGEEDLQPSSIVAHFKQQHVENARQKLLASAQVTADQQSDEFIRFHRFYRELRHALKQGKAYPSEKFEFKREWRRPLTDSDREYSARRVEVMGIEIPVGGSS